MEPKRTIFGFTGAALGLHPAAKPRAVVDVGPVIIVWDRYCPCCRLGDDLAPPAIQCVVRPEVDNGPVLLADVFAALRDRGDGYCCATHRIVAGVRALYPGQNAYKAVIRADGEPLRGYPKKEEEVKEDAGLDDELGEMGGRRSVCVVD